MIKFKIKELIEQKSLDEGRKVTLNEVADAVGIQKSAMSKIAGPNEYVTTTRTINALCEYFDCNIEELVEFVKSC